MRRIDDIITERVAEALVNNGLPAAEREKFELGIMPAPVPVDPSRPSAGLADTLYGALLYLAFQLPLQPEDRIEHVVQLKNPYGPQSMYDQLVKDLLDRTYAELDDYQDPRTALREVAEARSAGGLIIPS